MNIPSPSGERFGRYSQEKGRKSSLLQLDSRLLMIQMNIHRILIKEPVGLNRIIFLGLSQLGLLIHLGSQEGTRCVHVIGKWMTAKNVLLLCCVCFNYLLSLISWFCINISLLVATLNFDYKIIYLVWTDLFSAIILDSSQRLELKMVNSYNINV